MQISSYYWYNFFILIKFINKNYLKLTYYLYYLNNAFLIYSSLTKKEFVTSYFIVYTINRAVRQELKKTIDFFFKTLILYIYIYFFIKDKFFNNMKSKNIKKV